MKQALEFFSHPRNLSTVRDFVRAFLASTTFTEFEADLMVLGIDEACTNIIRYAYDHDETQPITLQCECNSGGVTFRLRDLGKQCDPSKLCARPLDEIKPGGLGLHIIKRAFDRVDYVLKEKGTELVLEKSFSVTEDHRKEEPVT